MIRRTIVAVMICVGTAASAGAQWIHYPAPGIPRTKDGKPDLSAATPKGVNGKPDLSGIWSTDPTPFEEMDRLFPFFKAFAVPGDDPRMFTKYFMDVFAGVRPEDVPMRPEAAQLFMQRMAAVDSAREAPTARCFPAGIPMGDLLPLPRRVIHTPGLLAILYEGINPHRMIYLDGRSLPADPQPHGWDIRRQVGRRHARGREQRLQRPKLAGRHGTPRSEATRITERLRRRDFGHMEVEVTIDDPKSYTKPFSIRYTQTLVPDTDILEYICTENEKDRAHLPAK